MANLTVGVNLVGHDSLTPVLNKSESAFESLTRGFFAFNQAQQAIGTIGGAVSSFAQSLTGPAQEMEAARARIQAFTKDAGATEDILRAVRAEADKTPFSFGEMAKAAASLGPTAKRAGVDLTSLLQTAEALSAADPAQGFEGAVMALREAMSGDLMSLRERFEVDTKEMNAAIQAGVSPIEAITAGLEKQGINLDMVKNLAQTTTGRMSTFNDMLEGLRRTAGEEILKGFGTQLDNMSKLVTENIDVLTTLARALGQGLAAAIELGGAAFAAFMPILRDLLGRLAGEAPRIMANFQETLTRVADQVVLLSRTLFGLWESIQPVISIVSRQLQPVFEFLARNLTSVVIPAFIALGVVVTAQAAAMVIALLPVIAPIAAIGAAIMLLNEVWSNNWGDIQGKTQAVWEFLSTVVFPPLQAFFELMTNTILPALAIGWTVTWDSFQTKATEVWGFLYNSIFLPLGAAYNLLTEEIIPALKKKWDEDWQGISDKADEVWKFLSTFVFAPIGAAMDLLRGTWLPNLRREWDSIWQGLADTAERITNDITGFFDTLKNNLDTAWGTIKTNTSTIVNDIVAFLAQSWDNINRVAGEWWTTIKDTIWNSIKPLADLVQGMVNGIQSALNSIKVPNIPLPNFGGAASTAAAAAQTGFNWATYNFEKNMGATEEQARKKAEGRGGGDLPPADGWVRPTSGSITQAYGRTAFALANPGIYPNGIHTGVDLGAAMGARVVAANSGRVVYAGWDNSGFGNLVKIAHAGGIYSLYAHLSRIGVATGSMVNTGEDIGNVGSTGKSTAAHLHFELQRGSSHFDPRSLVGLATGARNFGGGWAVVGERGWELAHLPRGTDVYSHQESKAMLAGGGGAAILVEVPISIDGEVIARVNRTYQSRHESRNRVGGVGGLV